MYRGVDSVGEQTGHEGAGWGPKQPQPRLLQLRSQNREDRMQRKPKLGLQDLDDKRKPFCQLRAQ